MHYFKRHWNGTRGDAFDHWGTSDWYLELDNDGYPVRQIEVYDNGISLMYDQNNLVDEYGMLGDQSLDLDEFSEYAIDKEVFEEAWRYYKPVAKNRK